MLLGKQCVNKLFQFGPPIIETALFKAGVLTILLYTESALLPLLMELTELFNCHVCHTR